MKTLLRSPRLILCELAGIALAGVIGAIVPQLGTATPAQLARLHDSGPLMLTLVQGFALDHVFRSSWFLALALLASASLAITIVEQGKRLRAHWTKRRLAGSVLLHTGILLVILAGALRALFGADAVVDLLEGETLAPYASAWAAQWPGVLGRSVSLDRPVTLKAVQARRYEGGDLRELKLNLELQQGNVSRPAVVAINQDLHLAGERLFLTSDFGPAALVEWRSQAQAPKREAVLLAEQAGRKDFEGASSGPNGLRAYLRAQVDGAGHPPEFIEVRVMKVLGDGQALIFTGDARVGQTCPLPGGVELALCGTPFWARLRASRDCALWLACLGFGLVTAGVAIIFLFVKMPARRLASWIVLGVCVSSLCGCQRASFEQARKMVEHYNQVVSEAYRRGDIKLADPVVGPNEGRKLTGLIGVRLDLGLTLDSHLLSLQVTRVEKSNDEMRVQTKERWRYRDLKIGAGQQVGEASLDFYEMLYVFKKINRQWLVDEIRFTSPPQIGRKQTPWLAERGAMHVMAGSVPPLPVGRGEGRGEGDLMKKEANP